MNDLLIKGVIMPKTCSKCPACQFSKFSIELQCSITGESIFFDATKKRAGNCPLVNILPHSKLIGSIIDNAPTTIESEARDEYFAENKWSNLWEKKFG